MWKILCAALVLSEIGPSGGYHAFKPGVIRITEARIDSAETAPGS